MEVGFDPIGYKHAVAEKIYKKHSDHHHFFNLSVDYHGVNVKFHLEDKKLQNIIETGLPQQWFHSLSGDFDLEVYWYNAENWVSDTEIFEEDPNPDYRFGKIEDHLVVYQRDMVATHLGHGRWIVCSNPVIYDGVTNFFRLIIPGYLLEKDCLVLHSNCVLGKDDNAHVFLGESGAGKSTTASMAEDRLVVGDDINIYKVTENGIFAQSSFLGGNRKYKAPYENQYKVSDFYWLYQDSHTWFRPIDKATFAKRMMMSVILWTGNPDILTPDQRVFSLVMKMAAQTSFFNMGFNKANNNFYNAIETGFGYERNESRA